MSPKSFRDFLDDSFAASDDIGSIEMGEMASTEPRRVIVLRAGGLHEAREAVLAELERNAAAQNLFVHGARLVQPLRVTRDGFPDDAGVPEVAVSTELVPIRCAEFRARLTSLVDFRRARGRERPAADCPADLAASILDSPAALGRLRNIERIAQTPLLFNGRVITERGLHRAVWVDAPDIALPSDPRRNEAVAALGRLRGWLDEFPFSSAGDRSAALVLLMTAALRASLGAAPGFVVRKPAFGSGASTLARLAAIVASGSAPGVLAASLDPAELDKLLASSLLSGRTVLVLDNLPEGRPLASALLAQMLSEPRVIARELGSSVSHDVDAGRLIIATGCNVSVAADLARRVVTITLDPRCEHPADRRYRRPRLVEEFTAARASVLTDLFTIAVAFARSHDAVSLRPLAGFEGWARAAVAPFVWLGEHDPIASVHAQSSADPSVRALAGVLPQVQALVPAGADGITTRHLLALAGSELQDLLADVLGCVGREALAPRRLGAWFSAVAGRVVEGRRLVARGSTGGVQRWAVETLEPVQPETDHLDPPDPLS